MMKRFFQIKTIQGAISAALLFVAVPAIIITASLAAWLSSNFATEAANDLRAGIESVAKERMSERAHKKIAEVLQVANSTLVGTALLDTSGRETYLRPYLEERATFTGARFGVYDYRGRPVLQISGGDSAAITPRPDLVDIQATRLTLEEDTLLVENPIRAYDGAIIGYLIGRVPLLDFLHEAQVLPSRFFQVSAELRLNVPDEEAGANWFLLYDEGSARLFGTIEVEASWSWFRQHLSETAQAAAIIVAVMIIFAAFLARIFASRLTRPLRQLTAATALFRNGRIARLPTSSMIELDALARALETTFQERRILEDRLKEIAAKDQLLQITNRAHFDAEATELLTGLQSDNQACLLFIDLDHFKQINDKYGHEAGDRVLQIAVDRIKSRIRHTDLIGRRGGDELTLLLNNVDREIATKIGHDLVRIISEPIMLDGIGRVNVGASIGLAHFPDDASTLKDLMTAADTAMYQAKANGRGRVTNFEKAHAP